MSTSRRGSADEQQPPMKRARVRRYAAWDDRPSLIAAVAAEAGRRTTIAERYPYYAAPAAARPLTPWFPLEGQPADYTYTRVAEYQLLDFNPQLNTSSYVNVVFEDEELRAAQLGLQINIADQTIYNGSFHMHNDTLNMVADLWHCPKDESFEEYGCFPGAGTVGSTEGCLLAGLALKLRWREWYRKRYGMSEAEVRAVYPNIVISTCFQACWEKFVRYMDVEPNFVVPSMHTFTLDPDSVAQACNEKTIGVVAILGNHYGGQYDPVADIAAALDALNLEKGWQVGIHVDAASGGFVAPFQPGVPLWDFRLPAVLSISASGHKFGESCCGTGWVVWRQRKGLSEHVAVSVSYLGGKGESYTLNFSRPASGIYVQLYKFLRLGREGYAMLVKNQMSAAAYIRSRLHEMQHDSKALFAILDNGEENCLPVVTAMFNPELDLPFDSKDLQHVLAERHWYVSGYSVCAAASSRAQAMSYHHPVTKELKSLFSDAPPNRTMFRIVVKANLTRALAGDLVESIETAVKYLHAVGKGFADMHAHSHMVSRNSPQHAVPC